MKQFLMIFMAALLIPVASNAAFLQDTQGADQMGITWQSHVEGSFYTEVFETIADSNIIPYESHDGNAIVSIWNGFFDSYVLPSEGDIANGFMEISFYITNNSGRHWSDFHFEFYAPWSGFGLPLPIYVESVLKGDHFESQNFDSPGSYTALHFWSESAGLNDGDTAFFNFSLDVSSIPEGFIEMRQIATTVPVPGAFLLLASGLVGLTGFGRKTKS